MSDLERRSTALDEAEDADGALSFRRLDHVLRALPERELLGLIRRLGIRIDPQKRIDVPSQVARVLVGQPDVRDPSRLQHASRELLHRVAEAGGLLASPALPAGIEPLMARGILFVRRAEDDTSFEVVLPSAYLVQLPGWQGEDPRSMRALLAQAPFETISAVAAHYLGRPATPPIALALEPAWEVLTDTDKLRDEIERLPLLERRLLEAIDGLGGEVETTELLDLEREPMRLRSAKGVTTTRRGAGFSLEKRALLIPIHPNRHVVPAEVSRIVGAERMRDLELRRTAVRREILDDDHMPHRARFARDSAAFALAVAIAAREASGEVKPNVGTPKSLIVRLSQRFGRSPEAVGTISALSRAIGLWDPGALSTSTPPGSILVGDLGRLLFRTWLNGAVWDEARAEPELLRAMQDQRDPSPCNALRRIVIDALLDLREGGWIPYRSFERYVCEDPRGVGLERLFRRWAERVGVAEPPQIGDVVRRIVLESLPILGIVDIGEESRAGMSAVTGADGSGIRAADVATTAIRLTQRGRELCLDLTLAGRPDAPGDRVLAGKFVDGHVLRVGAGSLVGHVLALAPMVEIGRVEDALDLVLTPAAIAKAIGAGALGDEIRERIEVLATLPDSLSQILVQASIVVGKGTLVATGGFLWVDDADVRELLRTRRATADMFVDPSPPGGLLVHPQVEPERLVRRCRGLGVEVEVTGEAAMRVARTMTPRPAAVLDSTARSGTRAMTPSRPMPARSKTPFPKSR
jgi:hypothetical protein